MRRVDTRSLIVRLISATPSHLGTIRLPSANSSLVPWRAGQARAEASPVYEAVLVTGVGGTLDVEPILVRPCGVCQFPISIRVLGSYSWGNVALF